MHVADCGQQDREHGQSTNAAKDTIYKLCEPTWLAPLLAA